MDNQKKFKFEDIDLFYLEDVINNKVLYKVGVRVGKKKNHALLSDNKTYLIDPYNPNKLLYEEISLECRKCVVEPAEFPYYILSKEDCKKIEENAAYRAKFLQIVKDLHNFNK